MGLHADGPVQRVSRLLSAPGYSEMARDVDVRAMPGDKL